MVRSESAMTDKDVPFLQSIVALRLVEEGVEPLVEEGSRKYTNEIINQARQDAGLCGIDICGHCTTHNAVPCNSGYRFCIYDKDRNCRIHDKSDPLKASKICPKGICNEIVRIIKSRHRYHLPNFKNTDARKWFQNPFEIMKCFIPTEGYQDKETVEDTDCAGLLSVISNCKSFQSLVAEDLSSKDNIFVKMREARNEIFHSAGFKITKRETQEYVQLMLSILNDDMFLAHDKDAQAAAEKIQEIANSSVHVFCGEKVQDSRDVESASGFSSIHLIVRESCDGQKVMEQVFKSKPNKQSGSDILVNENGISAGTSNKPKQFIVIVFSPKKEKSDTPINVSRETNSKLTSGKTNGETLKQGVQTRPVIHQAMMATTSNN